VLTKMQVVQGTQVIAKLAVGWPKTVPSPVSPAVALVELVGAVEQVGEPVVPAQIKIPDVQIGLQMLDTVQTPPTSNGWPKTVPIPVKLAVALVEQVGVVEQVGEPVVPVQIKIPDVQIGLQMLDTVQTPPTSNGWPKTVPSRVKHAKEEAEVELVEV